ncbi:unnamed protein product [Discula destructiva]
METDLFFVFGKPGTYLLAHPNGYKTRNLPPAFEEQLDTYPVEKMISLAMHGDNVFCTWESRNGERRFYTHLHRVAYASLKTYIARHNIHSMNVTFGLELGHHFATSDDGSTSFRPLKGDPFKAVLQRLMSPGTQLKSFALGPFNSYVALYTDGSFHWAFRPASSYAELRKLLSSFKTGDLKFIALNPYRKNEYFVVLSNGQVHIQASSICVRDVAEVLAQYPNINITSSEEATFSTVTKPARLSAFRSVFRTNRQGTRA